VPVRPPSLLATPPRFERSAESADSPASQFDLDIDVDPDLGRAPLSVDFRAVTGGNSEELFYRWDFGDGSSATGRHVRHVYRSPGTFTARLTARSAAYVSRVRDVLVQVDPPVPMTD